MSIQQALSVALLFALVPAFIFSVWQGAALRRAAEQVVAARLHNGAEALAMVQEENFLVVRRALEQHASDPAVRSIGVDCSVNLRRIANSQRSVVNYIRSDAGGVVRCSALPYTGEVGFSDENWWMEARNAPGFTLSDPVFGRVSRRRVIVAAVPLRTADGRFEGLVSGGVQIAWIAEALRNGAVGVDTYAALTDRQGRVIVASSADGPLEFAVADTDDELAEVRDGQGRHWVYGTSPLHSGQFHLVYAQPDEAVNAIARQSWVNSLATPLLLSGLTLAALWFAANRLILRWLRPLRQLALDKDRSAASFDGAPTEIAALAADLAKMQADIADHNREVAAAAQKHLTLAREVHHRVRNNLQFTLSLISLQLPHLSSDKARAALIQFRSRASALSLIYRLMYSESIDDEGQVSAKQLMTALCEQLHRDANMLNIAPPECEAPESPISLDVATPVALIIVEAVTNAYRHAVRGQGDDQIMVRLVEHDAGWHLSIADNGAGFDLSSYTANLGLQLIRIFAGQLAGRFEVSSNLGQGSRIDVYFPSTSEFASARAAPGGGTSATI